jgi:molybdate transport system substrate-binding protein
MLRSTLMAGLAVVALMSGADAAEIRVFSTGASKAIVQALADGFAAKAGHTLVITSDTAGGVAKRVEAGEAFEVAIATKGVVDQLIGKGKLATGSRADIASTSIGIAVKDGADKPDISTMEAFKATLLAAKTVAYVDPASGGTSGIYIAVQIEKMGLTEALKPKLRLQSGGYVAEKVARGEAEIVIHQVSEILPVKGVTLIGGLPKEIQLVTTYSGGLAPNASEPAKAFLAHLIGPDSGAVLKSAGMDKPGAP